MVFKPYSYEQLSIWHFGALYKNIVSQKMYSTVTWEEGFRSTKYQLKA